MPRLSSDVGNKKKARTAIKISEKQKLVKKNALTEIADFCSMIRLFAYLTKNGTSPQDTISLLANEAQGIFKEPFVEARNHIVEEGIPIADSFYLTRFFPNEFISILRVGQSTGRLPEALNEYSKYLNGVITAQRGFKSALKYPVTMLIAAIIGTTAIIIGVVPKLKASIASMVGDKPVTLPLPTRMIFGLHDLLTIFGNVGVICFMVGLLYYFTFGPGKKHIMIMINKVPKVRKLQNNISWAQFLIMASICMRSGMTMAQMLYTMGESERPPELTDPKVFQQLYFNVKSGGQMLAPELEKVGASSKLVTLIAIGEKKGATEEVMQSYGNDIMESIPYDIQEVKVTVESIAIGFVACMGGGIVACVMITMLNMSSFV